ncbi:MAG: enoyl-CoA hydratase/isomerase family protein [Clostridia bacterium]|nr:enoyl-CoA hydratase/isomerase family protein [Deltaproteobacteria bacterium]
MSEYVLSQVVDKVATIRLNRPDKLNAFTDEMITSWLALLEQYRTSDDVNVIVITGTGRAFSTGGDVGKFADYASNTAAGIKARLAENVQRLAFKVQEIDKPVIAAVNGLATGGGVDVALMCDLRFAARSARFAETYVRMGLIPGAGGAYYLPRIVGAAKALELFWSCDSVDAEQAERIGLVNRVCDDERLAEETQAFAAKVARGAPLAVRLVKKLIYQGLTSDLRGALDLVASNMPVVRLSEDHKEAVAAYREKREPVFTGR